MVERAYWTGHLKLSLLTFPVRVYNAVTSSGRVSLHQLHRQTMQRIHYTKTADGVGEVPPDDIVKGYEYAKGKYVVLDAEDLEKVSLETTKTLDLVQFVDREDLDPIWRDQPYFLAPDGTVAEAAFNVIRSALAESGKIGIGRIVFSSKERIAALEDHGEGFLLTTLHYTNEVRTADRFFSDLAPTKIAPDELMLAKQLIAAKTAPFDPKQFVDRYQAALLDLVNAKVEGHVPDAPSAPQSGKVINLMDALKRSVADSQKAAANVNAPKTAASSGKPARAGKSAKAKKAEEPVAADPAPAEAKPTRRRKSA